MKKIKPVSYQVIIVYKNDLRLNKDVKSVRSNQHISSLAHFTNGLFFISFLSIDFIKKLPSILFYRSKMALKWGILSAGKISHDFANAMGTLDKNDHQIVAVAARDLKRAQVFANRFDIPKAYSSYLELAQNPDIEVVYVGALHTQHLNTSLLMLEHGKHILCENPLCMTEKQTKQLIAYAKQKKLFLMEAIWSRCFPSYQYIREQIESGKLGEIQSVEVEMGVPSSAGAQNMM